MANALLGGREIGTIYSKQFGRPLTVMMSADPMSTGRGNVRADDVSGNVKMDHPAIDLYFNGDAVAPPPNFTPGILGRSTVYRTRIRGFGTLLITRRLLSTSDTASSFGAPP